MSFHALEDLKHINSFKSGFKNESKYYEGNHLGTKQNIKTLLLKQAESLPNILWISPKLFQQDFGLEEN